MVSCCELSVWSCHIQIQRLINYHRRSVYRKFKCSLKSLDRSILFFRGLGRKDCEGHELIRSTEVEELLIHRVLLVFFTIYLAFLPEILSPSAQRNLRLILYIDPFDCNLCILILCHPAAWARLGGKTKSSTQSSKYMHLYFCRELRLELYKFNCHITKY